jgi:hypothetical protein
VRVNRVSVNRVIDLVDDDDDDADDADDANDTIGVCRDGYRVQLY